MVNCFETYSVAHYAYFTAKLHQFLKTSGQFENLVFVIMSTRENIRLIARTPLTICMLVPPAVKLCKQFGPSPNPTIRWSWSGSELFDTLMLSLKDCCWLKRPFRVNIRKKKAYEINSTNILGVLVFVFTLVIFSI